MSFIAQSQQTQRSQRTQSPTANILQSGGDCGCNSGSHSLIAQSQKVGCGCEDGGTNTFDKTFEDSNPPQPVFQTPDGYDCWLEFSHTTTEVVQDTPLQDNPDRTIYHYKLKCRKLDGGGGDTGRGGGTSTPFDTPPVSTDPLDFSESVDRRICATCDVVRKLFNKIKDAVVGNNLYPDLTDEERRLFIALYGLLREAFKNSIERAFTGESDPNLRNQKGETDEVILEEMEVLYNRLKLHGNVMDPASNVMSERGEMFKYLLEYLNLLQKCPSAVFIKLQRIPIVTFKFETMHLQNPISNKQATIYEQDPPIEIKEFNSNDEDRIFYSSNYGIARNPPWDKDCPNGYSIVRWENGPYGYNWSRLVSDMIL